MSQARVYRTAKVRKDWKCESCGAAIRKGIDGRISFAVGFRGFEHTRCTRPECYPTRAELESSAVASVYAAIDGVDLSSCESVEDFEAALEEIASACDEVADEYESNEMYEINEMLQERAETVRNAGDELRSWSWDGEDEPQSDAQCETCEGHGTLNDDEENCPDCGGTGYISDEDAAAAHEEWLGQLRESAQEAIDSMELP